jgi:hypothetical protein
MPIFSRKWGMENGKAKKFDDVVMDIPIGSGPYRIGPVSFGKDITYVRDPNYWARDLNVRRGTANFDRITVKIYKDNTGQAGGAEGRRVRHDALLLRRRLGAARRRPQVQDRRTGEGRVPPQAAGGLPELRPEHCAAQAAGRAGARGARAWRWTTST